MGTGDPRALEIRHIPTTGDIQEGDLLVTSGLGDRFPADYPVARVMQVTRAAGRAFAGVTARPSAHLDRSRNALLVWPASFEGSGDTVLARGEAQHD